MERTRPDGRTTPIGAPAARGLRPVSDAYARAGVDIDAGNAAVDRYRALTADWRHPDQIGAIGGFSGLFRLPGDATRALVGSTDGVGTKILIAAALERYDGVGTRSRQPLRQRHPRRLGDAAVLPRLPRRRQAGAGDGGRCRARRPERVQAATRWRCWAARRPRCPASTSPATSTSPERSSAWSSSPPCRSTTRVAEGDAILGLPSVGLHTNGYTLARALIPVDAYAVRSARAPSAMRCWRRTARTTPTCGRSSASPT